MERTMDDNIRHMQLDGTQYGVLGVHDRGSADRGRNERRALENETPKL